MLVMSWPTIDHIILLLPSKSSANFTPTIPSSIAAHFVVTPGGLHADNLTSNALISLRSGTYLELVAFNPDIPLHSRINHWWGDKPYGWIDWCLGGGGGAEAVRNRLADIDLYDKPVGGGRTRPDGQRIEWLVTFPRKTGAGASFSRGVIPFWCHDKTLRELRVPAGDEHVVHPCGAINVAAVRVVAGSVEVRDEMAKAYESILGARSLVASSEDSMVFEIMAPTETFQACKLILGLSRDEIEDSAAQITGQRGGAVVEVVLCVGKTESLPRPILQEIEGYKFQLSFCTGQC